MSITNEDVSSIKPIPQEQLLGFDKDGNIFIEKWLKELSLHFSGVYGRMAECLEYLLPRPYHNPKAVFRYVDENGADIPVPKETVDFIGFNEVKTRMLNFNNDKTLWSNVAPKMCTNLILVKASQVRLLTLKEKEVLALRSAKDVLGLVNQIIAIHAYKVDVFDDRDIRAATAEWSIFGETLMKGNTTLQEHNSNSEYNSEFEEDPIPNLNVYLDHSHAPRTNRVNTKGFAFTLEEGRYPLENHQSVEAAVERKMQDLKAIHQKTLQQHAAFRHSSMQVLRALNQETLQQHAAFRQLSDDSLEMIELQERHRKTLRQNDAFRELSEDSPVYSRQIYSVDSDQNMDEEFSDSEKNGTSQVIEDPASYWFDMSNQDTIREKILSDTPWTPEEIEG